MSAIDFGVLGKCRQFGERGDHLLRCAFEQAAATAGKQGVPAEQHAVAVKGDVAGRVAGNVEHGKCQAKRVYRHLIALGQRMGEARDVLVARAIHGYVAVRSQVRHSTHMVGMVMGGQDGDQLQLVLAKKSLHGRGVARIHGHRVAAVV